MEFPQLMIVMPKNRFLDNKEGFSLVEILLAVFILGIAIAPMVAAFGPSLFSVQNRTEELEIFTAQANGTSNRIVDLEFATLAANTGCPADLTALFGSADEANKENFTYRGNHYTPVVGIFDVGGGTGELLEITVALGDVTLKTLKADY